MPKTALAAITAPALITTGAAVASGYANRPGTLRAEVSSVHAQTGGRYPGDATWG
jgi:hypothetical protein